MAENNQQLIIRQYFNSLIQEFIKDLSHKDITIVFTDCLGENLALTENWMRGTQEDNNKNKWTN